MSNIQIRTAYTCDRLLRFQKHQLKKRKGDILTGILALDIVLCIILNVDPAFVILSGVILAFFVYLRILILINNKRALKKARSMNTVCIFTFTEENIHVDADSSLAHESSDVKYTGIVKVHETPDDIYLFLTNNHAYILDKSDVLSGSVDLLRPLLRRTVGENNYRIFP